MELSEREKEIAARAIRYFMMYALDDDENEEWEQFYKKLVN